MLWHRGLRRCGLGALYAGKDDFTTFEALKDQLARTRPKDSTLDYAQRRGLEPPTEPSRKVNERDAPREREPDQLPIERFKQAQREFTRVAGRFDLDPEAKVRAAELRQQMESISQEISRSAGLMQEAEQAGIADR